MKKYFKRISALLIAAIMVLGMCTTAFAASKGTDGVYGTSDDTGVITITGVEDTNATAVAYPIVRANYDNGGQFSGYESLYPSVFTVSAGVNLTLTEEQLSTIVKSVTGTSYTMVRDTTDTTKFTKEVPVGSYLILIQNAEEKIYSPVVVSTYYVNASGNNDLSEGIVDVKEGKGWVKVRNNPTFDKILTATDKTSKGNTVNIGDTVSYKLSTTIPYYSGNYPVFEIKDTMTKLTYKDGLTVTVGEGETSTTLTENVHYTVGNLVGTKEFTVNFVVNGVYTLNNYQGQNLNITFNATLDDDANINQNGNPNNAVLTFSTDSTQSGQTDTISAGTKTYTFDLDAAVTGSVTEKILTKVGEDVVDGQKQPLEGAVFTLYTDQACTTDKVYTNNVFDGTVTSNATGQLPIKGLKQGTYYLKETQAPSGYSLINTVYTITIDATIDALGELTAWTITVNGDTIDTAVTNTYTVNNGTVTKTTGGEVEIPNTKIASLPSTGGIGTTIFTVVGCLIMIAAAAMFFVSRRRTEK